MNTTRHALFSFIAQYRRHVFRGLFLSVAGTLLGFVFPVITRWFVDDIIPHRRLELIALAVEIALAAFLLRQLFWGLRIIANNAFELQMTFDLRSLLHDRIQRLPLKWFDTQSPGDILIRMGEDVPAAQRMVVDLVDQGTPAVLQALVCVVMMLQLQWQLALVLFIPLPFVVFGGWLYLRWVAPRAVETRQAAGSLSAVVYDNIGGIRQIKSFTGETRKQASFEKSGFIYKTQSRKLAQ
ncbi:MAG: transporter ATP-binding protein, partial [Prosthecobacter sp.]|nr:transporter ATP-binding protein [Prosthecobacter sp.]